MARIWWILIDALKSLSNSHFDWSLLCKVFWSFGPSRIFTRTLRNLKIFTFMGYFCPKYKMFELKKYRGVMFYDKEEWCKTWKTNLTCGLENDMGNLEYFHQNTWKCLNWNFDGILLSKIENAWTKKLKKSYV